MSVRVVVADDEPIARKRLTRLLESEADAELVCACANGLETLDAIRRHGPDLLFLDVQMPGLDGFGVLSALREPPPAVVFVTAHDTYALQAFEANALDYLLKPFDAERFHRAYQRARDRLRLPQSGLEAGRLTDLLEQLARPKLDRIAVRTDGRVYFVRITDIDWVETAGNYVRLHTGKTEHLLREPLASLEGRLDPVRFIRIHRTRLVNAERIKEMQPWFSGEFILILHDGTRLKVSRGYRDRLARWLGQTL
jgi:two-component system LytT family response regulator